MITTRSKAVEGAARMTAAVAILVCGNALSQTAAQSSWPTKPVRWVVPYAPGGPTDVVSRIVAPGLAERIGQSVIIENRTGAAGNVGTEAVMKSAPDGHTLVYVVPAVIMNPFFFKSSPDPQALAPVIRVVSVSMVMLASSNFAPKSVAEVIALARAKPGTVSCGSAGGVPTVACELLRVHAESDMIMVMYKGQGPALNALMGGEINLLFDSVSTAMPSIKAGRTRPIATLGAKRGSGAFAMLPTIADTIPGFEFTIWHALMAPAATPRDILARINREVAGALSQPEIHQRLTDAGFEIADNSLEEFEALYRSETAKYTKALRDAGIKPE